MTFDYENLFISQLNEVKERLGFDNYKFDVEEEQNFIKKQFLDKDTIYVVIKHLQNSIELNVNSQPLQIFILSEQNSMEVAKAVFTDFARTYNWKVIYNTDVWAKQQYTEPVSISNFNEIDSGYRSILYISAMLYLMEDVIDLKSMKINNENVNALSFDISYAMTPNTQQVTGTSEFISKSVKSVSTLTINISIPAVKYTFMTKILSIMNETDTTTNDTKDGLALGGNENFYFDFYLGDVHFVNKKMKLIACDFGTMINNVPAIKLGFVL